MKITVEAVFATQIGNGMESHLYKVYLNDEFMGCLGFMGKLEFEAEKGENELKIIESQNNKIKMRVKFTATEDVYFWIVDCVSNWKGYYTKVYGKGKDYKLISESKE